MNPQNAWRGDCQTDVGYVPPPVSKPAQTNTAIPIGTRRMARKASVSIPEAVALIRGGVR